MSERQLHTVYRQKAAELRAAAEKTSNFVVKVELEHAADNYNALAELVEEQSTT